MTPTELKARTKAFAVNIVRFAVTLPTDVATTVIVRQIVKSGTANDKSR